MKHTRYATAAFLLLASVFFLTFGNIAIAAPGDLDLTFNLTGKRTDGFGFGRDSGRAIAIQPDGKIVAVGSSFNVANDDFSLLRFNPDGSLDTSFGSDGKVMTAIGMSNDNAYAVAIQSDGKIVVAGRSFNGFNWDFALARYNPDGSLDTSFDGDGKLTSGLFTTEDEAHAVIVQSDGKIIAAGYIVPGVSAAEFALVRYHADGSLDTSFDSDGIVTTRVGAGASFVNSIAVQSDNKIVAAGVSSGDSGYDFALARYAVNGSLDTSFDDDGKVTTPINFTTDVASSLAIQSDGKIVVAGYALISEINGNLDFAIARYNVNGSLDKSFDGDGKVTTAVGTGDDRASAVAIQPDGKIVAVGYGPVNSIYQFFLVRYNANGSLDTSFDTDGKVTVEIGTSEDYAYTAAIQSDGKIIAAGSSRMDSQDDFSFVRLNENGSLDSSFDLDGRVTGDVGNGPSDGTAIAVQSDGKIVVAGSAVTGFPSTWDFAVIRYNANGTLDTSFDGDGKVVTPVGVDDDQAFAVAIQPDGKIVVAGFSTSDSGSLFSVVRYNPNGSLDTSFDQDGKILTQIGISALGYAVAIQPDGKVIAAGMAFITGNYDFALVRYNTNGSLDTSFDGDGIVTTAMSTASGDTAFAVTIQTDGKIVAAGNADNRTATRHDFALARYNIDGSLDTSFDGDGKLTDSFGPDWDEARAVAIHPDGKILAVGSMRPPATVWEDFAIARYHPNGSPDMSFGSAGKVTTQIQELTDKASGVVIQNDGKIVVGGFALGSGGSASWRLAVVRYNVSGSLDPSFGIGGIKTIGFEGTLDHRCAIALYPTGRFVIAGGSGTFATARILGDLAPPPTPLSVTGRVMSTTGRGIPNARVTFTDTNGVSRSAITKTFGHYYFENVTEGASYTVSVTAKRYGPAQPRSVSVKESVNNMNFVLVQ